MNVSLLLAPYLRPLEARVANLENRVTRIERKALNLLAAQGAEAHDRPIDKKWRPIDGQKA